MSITRKHKLERTSLSPLVLVIVSSALLGTLLAPGCLAQAGVGGTSGVVNDSTGSAIPSAQVNMTETDTNSAHNTVTDNQGRYAFSNLPVGPYRLEVTAAGFKGYTQSGIVLQVGDNVQVNVTMQIGSLNEHVDVTASAGMVETSETAISQVIDSRRIVDLPLNGRQPMQLILLAGAAVSGPQADMAGPKAFYSSVTLNVAGGQAGGLNYLLDGGDHNDATMNVDLPFPVPDALQEFSVETSTVPARFGLHPGGVVNAVTKSGAKPSESATELISLECVMCGREEVPGITTALNSSTFGKPQSAGDPRIFQFALKLRF